MMIDEARQLMHQLDAAIVESISLSPDAARKRGNQRRRARGSATARDAGVDVIDRVIPSETCDIPVRVYRPATRDGSPTPLVVLAHGGGFVLGDLDTHDELCHVFALATESTVLAVDYRLAPEHPFPAAVDDVYSALCWAVEQANALCVDPARVALVGDSAGGNLAIASAILARDRGEPSLRYLALLYPVIDPNLNWASLEQGDGFIVSKTVMRWFWDHYLSSVDDRTSPLAAPLLADLAALPPCLVVTPEFDPLRDEGTAFAHALQNAGGEAELLFVPDLFHGFCSVADLLPVAAKARTEIAARIRSALAERCI